MSSLGDVLLTTPIVRLLKKKFTNAEISFLVKKEFADVYKFNPNISNIIEFSKSNIEQIASEISANKYDLIIDLQNNFYSRRITRSSNAEIKRFIKPTLKKLLLVYFKIDLLKNSKRIVERYAEVANVQLDDQGLDFFLPEDKIQTNNKNIGICPGAKHFTKRWLPEYFIQLGNELISKGFSISIFGGTADKEICKELENNIAGARNYQNENDLFATASNMKSCSLIITNDSGLMHLASALKIPIVAIFGSTIKSFGFSPFGVKNIIVENNSLNCRPCSHIGRNNCPKKHFKCMKDVTPQLVLGHLQNFMKSL